MSWKLKSDSIVELISAKKGYFFYSFLFSERNIDPWNPPEQSPDLKDEDKMESALTERGGPASYLPAWVRTQDAEICSTSSHTTKYRFIAFTQPIAGQQGRSRSKTQAQIQDVRRWGGVLKLKNKGAGQRRGGATCSDHLIIF